MKYEIKDIVNKDRIENFDYETVRKIMKLMNWTWCSYPLPDVTPNEQDMKRCVEELTLSALDYLKEGEATCSSGGFEVACSIFDGELLMKIAFIPVQNLFWR